MHHLRAIAHVTDDGRVPLRVRHLRVFSDRDALDIDTEHNLRASVTAAADFIFPYTNNSNKRSPTTKRPRSTNTNAANTAPRTGLRRLRYRFRLSSPLPASSPDRLDIQHKHRHTDTHTDIPSHVFAITHPDGSHEYCFCKHLSPTDALLIVASVPKCAFYIDVLERCSRSWVTLSTITLSSSTTSSARSSVSISSPASSAYSGTDTTNSPRKAQNNTANDTNPLLTFGHLNDSITSTWLTSHIHALIIGDLSLHAVEIDTDHSDDDYELCSPDSPSLPASPLQHPLADVPRLLHHISPRAISCVLAALMDERRVAVVGACAAQVSRIVLALYSILSPFEWPHLLSPVLPEKHSAVLGTPFPYLVGTTYAAYTAIDQSVMDGTLVVHAESGDTEIIGDRNEEFEALFAAIPKLAKLRLERRLAKIRNTRLHNINYNYDNMDSDVLDTVSLPAQYAVHCFFKNVLAEKSPHGNGNGNNEKVRRHRSFATRGNWDHLGFNSRRNGRRNLSWAASLHAAHINSDKTHLSLCTRFERTQMYHQWSERDDADRTFGIASLRTKQAAAMGSMVDLLSPSDQSGTSYAFLSGDKKQCHNEQQPSCGGLAYGHGNSNRNSNRRPLSWNASTSIMMRARVAEMN